MSEKVTVVIPNYNGINYIDKCLDSLRRQQYNEYNVVIIDNASSDGSFELIQDEYPEFTLIRNDVNTGFCKAVNRIGINRDEILDVLLTVQFRVLTRGNDEI